ncbi:hypothetical protein [Nostocoides australiense]|nr:DUF3515 domain-containing protein [Actinomycetota bacterium]HPF79691.1 hypothetical protein [Tetrasphaera australiensis]HRW00233.1 hypothetical protein [Tetrasphaera sp.]
MSTSEPNPGYAARPPERWGELLLTSPGRWGLAGLVAAPLLLAGCSPGGVDVSPAAQAEAAACQSVAWPDRLGELARTASPDDPSLAAWGDPPVIARCGIPALTPTTDECIAVNDVDWVLRKLDDGYAFTTYGTDPGLEVLVPDDYAPETMVLVDFTEIAKGLPRSGRACLAVRAVGASVPSGAPSG